jgi:hypothetical protein
LSRPVLRFDVPIGPDGGVVGADVVKAAVEQTWAGSVRRTQLALASEPDYRRATRKKREAMERRAIYARGVAVGFNAGRSFYESTSPEPPTAPPTAAAQEPPPAPPVQAPPLTPDPAPCERCNGSAVVLRPDGMLDECPACGGSGREP